METQIQDLWRGLKNIAKPFPFSEAWIWEDEDVYDEDGGFIEEASTKYNIIFHGSLYLGNHGCGRYSLLIVTGVSKKAFNETIATFCEYKRIVRLYL